MPISVDGNLVLDEEFRNPATGTAVENEGTPFDLQDEVLEAYLAGLSASSGFPQYAYKADYVSSSDTVTDYGFAKNTAGDAYSTVAGEGVDCGLTDVDGNAIYLFAYGSTNNVLLGVIGNDPAGTVAFALVMDEDIAGDNAADMWMIQYQPLEHGGANLVDADDVLSLLNGTNDIFIESTFSAPGQAILVTSETVSFEGHDLAGSNGAYLGGSKEVMHSQLADDFFVQFLGDHATGGKSAVPLTATGAAGAASAYAPGDLFHAAATSIQVTNSTNGVAGDTIQNGEVLDMLFLDSHSSSSGAATPVTVASQSATGMFLRFDGIGNREDLVVVLKLADPGNLGAITTISLVIGNEDILRNSTNLSQFPDYVTTAPAGELSYLERHPLDNNDGMVFIEANDYQFGAYAGMVIVGAQLLASTEKVTGSGIDLVGAVGAGGASDPDVLIAFGKTTTQDTDVIKISDIGFIRETPTTVVTHDYLGIGANLIIEDDGPVADDSSVDNLVTNNILGDSDDTVSGSLLFDGGADGVDSWNVVGAPDSGGFTASYDGSTQNITGQLNGADFYTLSVNDAGEYSFTLLGTLPGSSEAISSTTIHASGPITQKDILLENSTDYIRMTGTKDGAVASVNASNGFAGIDNGNLDSGETMAIALYDDNGTPLDMTDDFKRDFTGLDVPTKSGNATTHYEYLGYQDDVLVYSGEQDVPKNGSINVNSGGVLMDELVILDTNGNAIKVGIGDGVIHTLPPDIRLHFDLQLVDNDGDTDLVSFYVDIDGNGGGINSPTPYLAGDILV